MLIFLFWHQPERPDTYEADLIAFHRRLRAAGVDGCIDTASYRVSGLPWLDAETAYEDWYLVNGFADLGILNDAAVSPALRASHDRAAAASASGTGGLYAVLDGSPDLDAPIVSWIGKPRGVSYADFLAALPPTSCLLRRQLTLGPGLEFCAMGALPSGIQIARQRLC